MMEYLAKDHIAVNAIAPGYFPSKMTEATPGEESELIEGNTPMRRWGCHEDMAGVAPVPGLARQRFRVRIDRSG
jgi:NAD(P)-dependent dehydrogenase (short-subunit alcohol dehydrogenase family)